MHSCGSKLTSVGVFVCLFVSQFNLVLRVVKLHSGNITCSLGTRYESFPPRYWVIIKTVVLIKQRTNLVYCFLVKKHFTEILKCFFTA